MTASLKQAHYVQLSRMIEAHTGICLPPSKRLMIEGRLRKRLRVTGAATLEDYGAMLFDGGKLEHEFTALVDCVTTNKTDFFREPEHFKFLCEQVVPDMLADGDPGRPLKIWSAASSIGAEAYTIAMVLADLRNRMPQLLFSVLGTDISTEVLEQARKAVYPTIMAEPIPVALRRRYVMSSVDRTRQEVRIVPELRKLARFEQLNLMDESYPFDTDVDAIFCRNVLIYFSKQTQRAVLSRLCSHLRPGGYLFLGHSEAFAQEDRAHMRQVAPSVFQRAGFKGAR